jgi:hypothetical protein
MPSKAEAEKIDREVNETNNEHADELKGAMGGGGCSAELAKQSTGALAAVTNVADKIKAALAGTSIGSGLGLFGDDGLKKIYENAKKTRETALLNEYIAEQNYIMNKREGFEMSEMFKGIRERFTVSSTQGGASEYDTLLVNRFTAEANKDLEELNNKNIEVINLITDLIKVTQQQNIAVENMKKVMEDLDEKNKNLANMIYGGKSDLYTYNRKSMYESKLKESVENWTLIPQVVYWTLVILWVCIVMLYLRNITFMSIGILLGLILYPYFSTPIFLWILDKIQTIWKFIFIAVHNRITV